MTKSAGMPLCEALFCALIASFALPTGTVLGFPLRLTLLALSTLSMFPFMLDRRILQDGVVRGFAAVVLLLLAWTWWARCNGFSQTALGCLRQFISLIAVVAVGWAGVCAGALSRRRAVRALRLAALGSVLFKFAVEIVILAKLAILPGLNPTDSMIAILFRLFGAQLATCEIPLGYFSLYRVMLASDVLVLAVLPFELLRQQSWMRRAACVALSAAFVVLTYSRVVMVQYAVLLAVCAVVVLPRRQLVRWLGVVLVGLAAVSPIGWRMAKPMLYDRLLSPDAQRSDGARSVQFRALTNGIAECPLLGHGTGAYLADCVRSEGEERYSYELQYLSFVYQFGVVGFALIVGGILFLCFRLCLSGVRTRPLRALVWCNLIVWAIKPLFNPQFLSSNSAAVVVATLFFGMTDRGDAHEATPDTSGDL